MIIVEISGGLGNQMFQYAAARALASRLGPAELKLDLSHFDSEQRVVELRQFSRKFKLRNFNITAPPANAQETTALRDRHSRNRLEQMICGIIRTRWRRMCFGHFVELSSNYEPSFEQINDNVYLTGYFQSERYFKRIASRIRTEFTFCNPEIPDEARSFVESIRARRPAAPVVSVHVRRGDLAFSHDVLKKPNLVYGPPVSLNYIHGAMGHFGDASFVVFSDSDADLDWCRQNIEPNAGASLNFSAGHDDLVDFAIMSACDHHILANSTFSWWAAWLNPSPKKQVIAPARWLEPSQYPHHEMRSLIPEEWIIKS